jgi:hypothetical protein
MRIRSLWLILLLGVLAAAPVGASQIIVSTGYAHSQRPKAQGFPASRYFDSGSGYAVGIHLDLETPVVWFGPSFLFWNNMTGDPDPDRNSSYFQIELGGRLSVHTNTIPAVYAGIGAGYSVARGDVRARFAELGGEYGFDGEFPTASIHLGAKSPTRTTGLGLLAEASYHFGLDDPSGIEVIGPAEAWMIQIGVVFDTRFARE